MTYHGGVTLNAWVEIVVISLLLGNVFNLLGFIATAWAYPKDRLDDVQKDYEGLGLWRSCLKDQDSTELICTNLAGHSSLPGWFQAVQALICLGFICSVLSFATILLYACAQLCAQSRRALLFAIVTNYAGVLFELVGLSLFGSQISDSTLLGATEGYTLDKHSWCFILCAIATVVFALTGVLIIFELLTLPINPYIEEDLTGEPGDADGAGHVVIGGTGNGGAFPAGGTLEIQMKSGGDEVQELTMEDPGVKTISLA